MKQTKIFWGFLLLITTLVTGFSNKKEGNNDSEAQGPGLYYQIGNSEKILWNANTFKSALTSDATVFISTTGSTKMNSTDYKSLLDATKSISCTGLTLDFSGATAEEDAMNREDNTEYENIKAISGFPTGITSLQCTFRNFSNLTSVAEIPNSVTNMGGTFRKCTSFNQLITIPNSVTDMYGTFYNCTSLNQLITIPNSVTAMCFTFSRCSSLNQPITIPNSVMGVCHTFSNCPALASTITIYGDSNLDTDEAFDGTTNTANITLILGSERTEWAGGNTWAGYTFKSITRASAE